MGIFSHRYKGSARLDGKTAVITGCGTGIGKATAQDLYKRGCRIVMACIDLDEAYLAMHDIIKTYEGCSGTGELVLHKLDLASIKSVRQFAAKVMAEESRIDILINNAGVLCSKPLTTEDGFEMNFGVNHLDAGNVEWENYLMGSGLNSATPYNPFKEYAISKLAVLLFTKELARRLEGSNVTVYAVHPGAVKTGITHQLENTFWPCLWVYHHFGFPWVKNLQQGAATSIYCAVDEQAGRETGLYYEDCQPKRNHPSAEDAESASKLWCLSATMTQLTHEFDADFVEPSLQYHQQQSYKPMR